MQADGYIKFHCLREENDPDVEEQLLLTINRIRGLLKDKEWLGISESIGYGNLSIRDIHGDGFLISGSASGGLERLSKETISRVYRWDYSSNTLWCRGFCDASSESLSHAAIYEALPQVLAVVHIHDSALWIAMQENLCSTPAGIEYGSVAMAEAVKKAVTNKTDLSILRMGGHEGGFLLWGASLDEIWSRLLELYHEEIGDED